MSFNLESTTLGSYRSVTFLKPQIDEDMEHVVGKCVSNLKKQRYYYYNN